MTICNGSEGVGRWRKTVAECKPCEKIQKKKERGLQEHLYLRKCDWKVLSRQIILNSYSHPPQSSQNRNDWLLFLYIFKKMLSVPCTQTWRAVLYSKYGHQSLNHQGYHGADKKSHYACHHQLAICHFPQMQHGEIEFYHLEDLNDTPTTLLMNSIPKTTPPKKIFINKSITII